MTEHNRRATDSPDSVERIVSLEVNVQHVKESVNDVKESVTSLAEDLREHIRSEDGIAGSITQLRVAAEMNNETLNRMASALEQVPTQNTRVHSLEEWRGRVDTWVEKTEARQDDSGEKINRIYWMCGLIAAVIPGVWALLTYFKAI